MGILLAIGFGIILWAVMGDPITELPFGMQEPMQVFINNLVIAYNVFPPLETVMIVLSIALTVKVSMFVFKLVIQLLQIVRG